MNKDLFMLQDMMQKEAQRETGDQRHEPNGEAMA